jgi:hypothetical protein
LHVPGSWHWSEATHVTLPDPVQMPAWQVSVVVHALPSLHAVPSVLAGFEQTPVAVLQVPALWHWSSAAHVTGLAPVQAPDWHVSVVVQALPSSQEDPLLLAGFEHAPVDGSHVPAAWHWSEARQATGLLPLQTPAWQVSVCVQAFPSLQGVPLLFAGLEHAPVEESHVPATWHWSDAAHATGFDPVQMPAWQVSVCVQAFPSLHAVPFVLAGFEQTPVAALQEPALWHWSSAAQVTGFPPVQTPAWQVSVCVQALPSLQGVPSGWLGAAEHVPLAGLHEPAP